VVSLGSNIDAAHNLPAAFDRLKRQDEIEVLAVSPIYRSAAVGP
jgi:7,8-dihydro-6-hydroxymethylpterin-pyrophosphokinase